MENASSETKELATHDSRALLLQSPIRCYDEPSAGGLAPRTLTVLHEYASGPQGSARRSRDAAQAISRRTVMNHAGLDCTEEEGALQEGMIAAAREKQFWYARSLRPARFATNLA